MPRANGCWRADRRECSAVRTAARSSSAVRTGSLSIRWRWLRRRCFARATTRSPSCAKMKCGEIERLLPSVFQRTLHAGGPLGCLLEVMEALHAPAEGVLAGLDAKFDTRRTEDGFVPFLARWVDLERIFEPQASGASSTARPPISTGLGRLRELTAAAAWLSKWRGTARGLRRFLHTATGETHFEIKENVDSAGRPRLF